MCSLGLTTCSLLWGTHLGYYRGTPVNSIGFQRSNCVDGNRRTSLVCSRAPPKSVGRGSACGFSICSRSGSASLALPWAPSSLFVDSAVSASDCAASLGESCVYERREFSMMTVFRTDELWKRTTAWMMEAFTCSAGTSVPSASTIVSSF